MSEKAWHLEPKNVDQSRRKWLNEQMELFLSGEGLI